MRFVIRNIHDVDGITEEIIGLIEKKYGFEYGAVFEFGDTNRNRRSDIDYLNCKYCTSDFCLIEKSVLNTPIPRDVLDAMLKYKSMACDMVVRESHYDIYRVSYVEKFYYQRLQFWYDFLISNRIDFVLFMVPPHHAGEFILYSLCEVLLIKKLVMIGVAPGGMVLPACDIYNESKTIINKMRMLPQGQYELGEVIRSYKDRVGIHKAIPDKVVEQARNDVHALLFSFVSTRRVLKSIRRLFTIPTLPRNRENREYLKEENKRYLKIAFDIKCEERHMDHIKDYKKLAVIPDLTRKYIYFPLQQEPEDTTMPRAGEFKNQILSLLILSEVAKKLGYTIYAKEHWIQEHRPGGYYKRLSEIENVELVDISFNSGDLINNSVAVASQTGSVILEAMILRKNALIFGAGCPYIGMPGSFFVGNTLDVMEAINRIEKNIAGITDEDVNHYLFAYQEACIELYCDSLSETYDTYNMKVSAKRIFECIAEQSGYL